MFVAFTARQLSLIAHCARLTLKNTTDRSSAEVQQLLDYVMAEQAKAETRTPEQARTDREAIERKRLMENYSGPIMPGDGTMPVQQVKLAPLDLKDCEGLPVVEEVPADLYRQIDAITEIPPRFVGKHPALGAPYTEAQPAPTEPSMGPEYHLLKFIDAMRDKNPYTDALTSTSTSDIIEVLGEAICIAASKRSGKPQALCQLFSMEMARIVNHLEEG